VGFAELIEHGVDGLVFDDNDDEAALRWLTLLRDDPQRRQAMGAAARAKAEATFGPALHDRIRTLYLGNPAVSAPLMPGN
jgi:glycosyltransferase involved in cell wall biosynthesis